MSRRIATKVSALEYFSFCISVDHFLILFQMHYRSTLIRDKTKWNKPNSNSQVEMVHFCTSWITQAKQSTPRINNSNKFSNIIHHESKVLGLEQQILTKLWVQELVLPNWTPTESRTLVNCLGYQLSRFRMGKGMFLVSMDNRLWHIMLPHLLMALNRYK